MTGPLKLSTVSVFVLACAVPHMAAETNVRQITLDEALAIAEEHHPQLRAASAQIEGAQAGITTASAYPNPEFNLLSGNQHLRMNTSVPGMLQHYSFSQPIDLPKVRRPRIQAAQLGRTSSEYAMDEARLAVRGAVKQAFYEALRRKGEVGLAIENLRLIEDLRRRIQLQVNVGEAAKLELIRAHAELATARTAARSAELRLVTAIAALRAAMNAPFQDNLDPQGDLDPPQILPPLDELRREVLSRHPAVAQAKTEIQRANALLDHEKALRLPQPVLRGEFEQQPDLGFFRLGVSVPLPVWNRREGPINEAVANLRRAEAIAEYRQLQISSELERAYRQYEVANQQVAAYEDGVLEEAAAALRAAEAAFRFGERGIIEVLDAQRVLRNVRIDYLNARFDRQAALIELEQLRAIDSRTRP